jgi:hypothetical protein
MFLNCTLIHKYFRVLMLMLFVALAIMGKYHHTHLPVATLALHSVATYRFAYSRLKALCSQTLSSRKFFATFAVYKV